VSTGVAWMDRWSDDVRRPAAGTGEGRGGGTIHGLRGAQVQAGRADRQAGRHASRRPKSSKNRAIWLVIIMIHTFLYCHKVITSDAVRGMWPHVDVCCRSDIRR